MASQSPLPRKTPERSPPPAKSPEKSPLPVKSPAKSPSPGSPGPSSGGILPAEYWTAQTPAPEDDDESALGSSVRDSTASITSSILNYRTLHGRTYHSDVGNASYWGANDEQQSESMDMNHHAHTLMCGDKLHLAPIEGDKVKKVLDIGTGTGIWAIDFGDTYPEAEVIGTDVSPIQSTWVPPNVKFEIEDCTREWTFNSESVDFVHMRWLFGSIADWDALYVEAYRTLRPGGWLESAESSVQVRSDHVEIPDNSATAQWSKFFIEGGKKMGRTCQVVDMNLQKKGMEKAGFVDIQVHEIKRPSGTWPKDKVLKEVGVLSMLTFMSDPEGFIYQLASILGWTREEIQVYIAHLRPEIMSGMYKPYYLQKVVVGRKPEKDVHSRSPPTEYF